MIYSENHEGRLAPARAPFAGRDGTREHLLTQMI
jgi:hypothetical protein